MARLGLYIIRWLFGLLLIMLVLTLSNVTCALGRHDDHHQRLFLDISDEVEDDDEFTHSETDLENLQLLNKVSVDIGDDDTRARIDELSNDLTSDDIMQYADELMVEDDCDDELYDDLKRVSARTEDYEEVYTTHEYDELPYCQEDVDNTDEYPRPAVVISTLDGRVTSLDVSTGAVLWSHVTGGKNKEMLKSSMSKLEVTSRGEWVRLIPSLDGGIYRFDGDAVEALPVTAETLLHSSFKFNSDTIFTGGKSTEVWGMALHTGKLIYMCNSSGCKQQQSAAKPTHMLVVKRVTQTVRAVDPKSGDERWNFSVGQHELNVAGGGCDWMGPADVPWNDLPSLHFIIPEGVVMGMNAQGQLVWQQKLTSPVVSAWKVKNGYLEQIDLFSTNSIPALTPDNGISDSDYRTQGRGVKQQAALYVGVHQKQLYIQQSGGMLHKVNSAFRGLTTGVSYEGGSSNEAAFPRVHWRPYLATALSRTPVVNFNERSHPLLINYEGREEVTAVAIHQNDYPFDNGYYLYVDENNGQLNFSGPWKAPTIDDETLMDDMTSHIVRICFQIGPDTWIKLACAIVFYTALHYLVLRWIMSQMRYHLTNQALNFIHIVLHRIIANNPNIFVIIQRIGVQLPHLPAPAAPAATAEEEESLPLPLSNEDDSQKPEVHSQFTSRYLSDFEPIRCLGRGGFGVVFHVYNKLDENEYAVKRITLPSKEASAERVKREVRALAKLNHTNIVRYYNSWLESPPLGWHDETEVQWKKHVSLSNTICTPEDEEETQDRGLEIGLDAEILGSNKDSLSGVLKKFGHSPIIYDPSELYSGSQNASFDKNYDKKNFETSTEYSKLSSNSKFNDNSIDIVFENSTSSLNLITNKSLPEDSFEILFQNSERISNSSCDNNDDLSLQKDKLRSYDDSKGFKSHPDNNLSFSTVNKKGYISSENSKQNNIAEYSSQSSVSHSPSKACFSNGTSVKHHQIESHSSFTDRQCGEERPSSLNLGTTVESSLKGVLGTFAPLPKTFLYIQMELCQKESLRDWLLKNCEFRENKVLLNMFNDIVRAVEYVHDNQLMHRDLKPSNIFFSLDNEIKIGDFGLVTQITEDEPEIRTPADPESSVFSSHRHTHRVGTQLYMSPEQINNQVYDYKVDIYSMGLIFFEMLVPFSTAMERHTVMSSLRKENFPEGFYDKFPDEAELLKMMLSSNPANRPTTRGIRARNPLRPLQGSSIDDILPEDHFRLNRQRSHTRSHSGSSFSFTSTSSS